MRKPTRARLGLDGSVLLCGHDACRGRLGQVMRLFNLSSEDPEELLRRFAFQALPGMTRGNDGVWSLTTYARARMSYGARISSAAGRQSSTSIYHHGHVRNLTASKHRRGGLFPPNLPLLPLPCTVRCPVAGCLAENAVPTDLLTHAHGYVPFDKEAFLAWCREQPADAARDRKTYYQRLRHQEHERSMQSRDEFIRWQARQSSGSPRTIEAWLRDVYGMPPGFAGGRDLPLLSAGAPPVATGLPVASPDRLAAYLLRSRRPGDRFIAATHPGMLAHLEARDTALEARVTALEARVTALEEKHAELLAQIEALRGDQQ